jgi:hypothetical protein
MEFCRLRSNFNIKDIEVKDEQMFFGENGQGIGYYHVDFPSKSELMNIIPKEYQQHFTITLMKVNIEVPPHTDSGIKSTINFYVETGECTTQFYEFLEQKVETKQVSGQTDGFIYDEKDLKETNSFVAEPGTAWLLDVSVPHSVKPGKNFKERLAVAMSSTLCYDDVKLILSKKGLL